MIRDQLGLASDVAREHLNQVCFVRFSFQFIHTGLLVLDVLFRRFFHDTMMCRVFSYTFLFSPVFFIFHLGIFPLPASFLGL